MEILRMVMRIWSVFLLLALWMIITLASSNERGNDIERLSLLAFKTEIVGDTLGILDSWNDTSNLCGEWQGITCGRRHQRVTVLDLQSSKLKGTLSSHIGNLSFLRTLNLQNNSFTATIPPEIGRLSRLQRLQLGDNSFEGDIPINISHCYNLQYLALANNTLSGKLPMELGSLLKLQVLSLRRNHLAGEIPPSFGNLSSLQFLSMEENNLHGDLMNSRLGKLVRLRYLALGTNRLTGSIPPSIYNLSSIEHISVIDNQFHGTLPSGLGYTIFPNLQTFLFQMNRFSGPIPFTISNASRLSQFLISNNSFTGKVPSLARVSNLVRLEMDDNNLGNGDGDLDFHSSLVNCTSLQRVDISGNNFQGVLPESISNLSKKLEVLSLGRNQVRGRIPIGIGNLISLIVLSLEKNLLTGPLPSSICEPSGLYFLFLNHNQLSGTIPSCLGKLTKLSRLDLMSNNLHGFIPESLGQCHFLQTLVLSQNNFSGFIPQELTGLSQILDLDLSHNQFTGYIPTELGSSFILSLNLSRNNLSGTIPSNFQSLPLLQSLDLSVNDLEGEVPTGGVLSNTSAVSLTGNRGLCGGVPQLNLPKCRVLPRLDLPKSEPPKKRLHMAGVISLGSLAIGISMVLCCVLHYRSKKKEKVKSSVIPLLDITLKSLLRLSYGDLLKATDGFSSRNLIGAGSSGSVYWGVLDQQEDGIVAVKVLNLQSSSASKSFAAECEVLKSIRHRNLVKLLTACSSVDFRGNEFKALVFEFMLDGNLDEWLHQLDHTVVGAPTVQVHLNLIQRVNIAIDIASALDYLHNYFHIPIVHCDLKPSNVLLEKDMTACVCDFGLASFLPQISCPISSLDRSSDTIAGSIGYVAPEYGMGSPVSTYGDVYSYGILLLEMLTGKRPTDDMFTDDFNLHKFVLLALPERVKEICDPMLLQGQESSTSTNPKITRNDVRNETRRVEECLVSIARIGVACSMHLREARMEIGKVVAELRVIRDVLTGTKLPREHMITSEGLSLQ